MVFASKKKTKAFRHNAMLRHREWAARKWERAFCDDWHYEYMLVHIRAKLETMEQYNLHLSYCANRSYYGHRIGTAIKMIDIIMVQGGEYEDIERPETFRHRVNMRNRHRIPQYDSEHVFWSDAQHLRFDKAWMLLWKILAECSMAWGD